jgi:glycosyltransferase involved in cell wall biosynthesis
MSRPNVYVVGPFSEQAGGVITFQKNLIEHSDLKDRWNLTQFNISRPPKKQKNSAHGYASFLQSGIARMTKAVSQTGWNMMRYPIEIRNADVLQIQSSDYYSFWEASIYTLMAKKIGIPTVVRFGGAFDRFYEGSSSTQQRLIRACLQHPDQIVVQSQKWKEYFSQYTNSERLNIVPNAVPFPPPIPKRTNPIPVALFICTAEAKRKGIETILKAAPSLRGVVRFLFVAANDEVQSQVSDLGLSDMIEIRGTVSREIMKRAIYPSCDIFLIPSHGEGFPNSMLEAMSAGMPVVGSFAGAIPEVIIPPKNGFLNDASDYEGLARDTRLLALDKELRAQQGIHNHHLCETTYEIKQLFRRFDTVWNKAIQSRNTRM